MFSRTYYKNDTGVIVMSYENNPSHRLFEGQDILILDDVYYPSSDYYIDIETNEPVFKTSPNITVVLGDTITFTNIPVNTTVTFDTPSVNGFVPVKNEISIDDGVFEFSTATVSNIYTFEFTNDHYLIQSIIVETNI